MYNIEKVYNAKTGDSVVTVTVNGSMIGTARYIPTGRFIVVNQYSMLFPFKAVMELFRNEDYTHVERIDHTIMKREDIDNV